VLKNIRKNVVDIYFFSPICDDVGVARSPLSNFGFSPEMKNTHKGETKN
jgi:hypothetical protein